MKRRQTAAPEHNARAGGRFALFPRRGELVTARRVRQLMETEAV